MIGRWLPKQKMSLPAALLGAYFIVLPLDCFSLGRLGSFLRVFALLPVIAAAGKGRCRKLYLNGPSMALMAFISVAFVSFLWTVSSTATLRALKTLALNGMMVLVTGACLDYTEADVKWLKGALVLGSWFTALLMLICGKLVEGRLVLTVGKSIQDANYASGFMLFAVSCHINAFFEKRQWRHLSASVFLMGMVLATGSRGAVVACAACVVIGIAFAGRRGWRQALIAAMMLAVVGGVFLTAVTRLRTGMLQRFSAEYLLEHGFTGRMDIWKYLMEVFADAGVFRQVFGHGYGTTMDLTALAGSLTVRGKVAHNLYLDILLNLGIAGLMAFAVMHVSVIKCLCRHGNRMLASVYGAFMVMCLSLSLISYKPIWALMTFAIIEDIQMRNAILGKCGGDGV